MCRSVIQIVIYNVPAITRFVMLPRSVRSLTFAVLLCGVGWGTGCDSTTPDPVEEPGTTLQLVSYLDNARTLHAVSDPASTRSGCYNGTTERMVPREGVLRTSPAGKVAVEIVFEGQSAAGAVTDTVRFEGDAESHERLRLLLTETGDTLAVALDEAETPARAVLLDINSALSKGTVAAPCAAFRFAADGVPFETFEPGGGETGTYDVVEIDVRHGRLSSAPGPHALPYPYPDGDVNYSVQLVSGRLDLARDGTYSSQKNVVELRGHRGNQETERTVSYQGAYVKGGPYYLFDPLVEPVLGIVTPTGLSIRGASQTSVYVPDTESSALTLWTTKANLRFERQGDGA